MKQKKILCIDLDDTISDTSEVMIKYAVNYNKDVLKKENRINYYISSDDYYYFSKMFNWNKDMTANFFKLYYPGYLKEVKCKKFSSEAIKDLKKAGFYIVIITARREKNDGQVYEITKRWLKENNILYDKLIVNSVEKDKYVSSCKAVAFVDDSFKNCIDVAANTDTTVYMMETWYNKKFKDKKVKKVVDWNELKEELLKLK